MIKKILIIRLSALGDTIHTLPLAKAIKDEYPDVRLDWIVEDKASSFILNNPLITKVYELPVKKWKQNRNKIINTIEYFKIIKEIRKEKYDIVIDTQQLLKSSFIMGLSAGKRKLTLDNGREFSFIFANEIIKTGRKQFDINYHVVKRNLEIAKYLGCKNLEPEFIIPDFSNEFSLKIKEIIDSLDTTKKTIVIAPATTWDNKHWSISGWIDVINEFKQDCNIVITASEKEKILTDKILSDISGKENIYDLSGKTTLADLVYIYNHSDVVISPDSGSTHIAWATGHCGIVTLFFATSKARTAPYGEKYFSISADIDCQPCMKKRCKNPILNLCSERISSKSVINIVKKVLQRK